MNWYEKAVEAKAKKKKPRRKKNKLGYPDHGKLDTQLFPNKKPPYVEK